MGTAQVQGPLWAAHARDWAEGQEGMHRPLYEAVFERLQIGPGTRLLDVGCGAAMAAQLAAERGARVAGIDASDASIEIARERVPSGDFRVGDLEALPFGDTCFDVVTGFNSFQYAGDPVAGLREATRVGRPGGQVVMAVWGAPEQCEHAATLKAIGALLPPPTPGAGGPFALSDPGKVESLMEQAGIRPVDGGEANCPFEYPEYETAWRALRSAGPSVRAIQQAGEEAVRAAILASLQPFKQPSGGYRQENVFRYVVGQIR